MALQSVSKGPTPPYRTCCAQAMFQQQIAVQSNSIDALGGSPEPFLAREIAIHARSVLHRALKRLYRLDSALWRATWGYVGPLTGLFQSTYGQLKSYLRLYRIWIVSKKMSEVVSGATKFLKNEFCIIPHHFRQFFRHEKNSTAQITRFADLTLSGERVAPGLNYVRGKGFLSPKKKRKKSGRGR